jgi:cytochrome P450
MLASGSMTLVTDLDLPRFDYTEPGLAGERFHERMRTLREQSWIARTDLGFVLLDRDAVNHFLKSKSAEFPGVKMFELLGITDGPLYESLSRNIISLNGDQHRRLRSLVHDEFTPKAADRYRPAMRAFLEQLFEPIAEAGRCDFVTAFGKPYPALMIATVVGAPLEDAPRLHELSNLLQSQFDAIAVMTRREELERAALEFDEYARGLVEKLREQPGDDLLSRLIAVEQEGDRLSTEECVHLVLDVMNGGVDTTQSQLAHGIRLFAGEPDQWRMLREDPSLAAAAAEEVLRFEPVAPFTSRVLLEPLEYRDVEFPAGSVVFASAWNANREATGDSEPERFDITAPRGSARSLTFGAGPHFCLGSNLARAELQEGLAFLARKMPGLELDGEPVYGTITGLYGMEALPIRWAA